MHIHGASKENITPVLDGLVETLFKSKELSTKILNSSKPSAANNLKRNSVKEWAKGFTDSNENLLRSLHTYYSHNVMGKSKYISIRKANKSACYLGNQVPKFVPYDVLARKN